MNSTSYGWLDTIKSWLFAPCSEDSDARSESVSVDEHRLPREKGLNRSDSEKSSYQVYYDQPRPTTPPRAATSRPVSRGRLHKDSRTARRRELDSEMGWMDKKFFSGKRKMRRPQISSPFNFQHTSTGAVSFRSSGPRSAPLFRPLELSMYESESRISPLLPHFIGANLSASPPRQTQAHADVFDDDDETTLAHSRSYSGLSFHIPRRPVGGDEASMMTTSNSDDSRPPRIPPRAAGRLRPRAYTSPSVERIVERIASAIIERDILEAEIASVKERASFCMSRPTTSYDLDEPLPEFPIVPPTAPSFAERVSIDRPRTAPPTQDTFQAPSPDLPPPPPPPRPAALYTKRTKSYDQQAQEPVSYTPVTPETPSSKLAAALTSAFNSHPPMSSPRIIDNSIDVSVPLAPPLPLILRPPLRKKKSFSRVSDWLFPAGVDKETGATATATATTAAAQHRQQTYPPVSYYSHHRRTSTLESVTNTPRALTDREGFYQTLPPSAVFSGRRTSYDSMSDVTHAQTESLYSTDSDGGRAGWGTGTVGTAATSSQWSPGSTPPEAARRGGKPHHHETNLSLSGMSVGRTGTFGSDKSGRSGRSSGKNSSPVEGPTARSSPVQGPRPTSVGVAF